MNNTNDICEELKQCFSAFLQTPYLFIGSGMSKRYAQAPSWMELLEQLWIESTNKTQEQFYMLKLEVEIQLKKDSGNIEDLCPILAKRISEEFNILFFTNKLKDNCISKEEKREILSNSYDPFKYYVAKTINKIKIDYSLEVSNEIIKLKAIQSKISGIITTNYDNIIESIFDEFDVIIGQNNLLISNNLGAFEIYKIHGCSSKPESIVITQQDYENFDKKLKYLSAKLLTFFVEHPIIFLGYSLSDSNIKKILHELVDCLTPEQLSTLQNKLFFVRIPNDDKEQPQIGQHTFEISGKTITTKEIILDDYSILYNAIDSIKSRLSIQMARKMKTMICNYILSTKSSTNIIVKHIDDPQISDDELGIYFGKINEISDFGYKSLTIDDICEDILLDNRPYLADKRFIEQSLLDIRARSGSSIIPVHKYLHKLNIPMDRIPDKLNIIKSYNDVKLNQNDISYTKKITKKYTFVDDIVNDFHDNIIRQFSLILKNIEIIDIDSLENYLKECYKENKQQKYVSTFRKLVALYDFKKYHKIN